jgi:hypothetical protein
MKNALLSFFLFGCCVMQMQAQEYRYLQIVIDSAYNLHFRELDWFDDGNTHPNTMTAYNQPSPLLVTGDNANWNIYRIYDDNIATQSYVNEVRASPEFTRTFTLDLGEGNSLSPDSIRLQKPSWSVLNAFRILLSNDAVNWDLYLDTTISVFNWETGVFPLNLITDTEPPSSPSNLMNPYVTSTKSYLEWTEASDNFRVDQYHIYQDNALIDSTKTTYFAAQNLSPNTNYNFQVHALDKARNISQPVAINSMTLAADNTAPILEGGIEMTQLTASTATFKWRQAIEQEGLSGYLIKLDTLIVGTTSDTIFSVCGLDTLTNYQLEIIAKDYDQNLSEPIKTSFRTLTDNKRMKLGTNFWNQNWSPENNQLFINGFQNVIGPNPWKPALLEEINYAQTLRFMEMQQINQNAVLPTYKWLDRKQKGNINQDEIAYEWMIDLCNRKNANLWICLPDQIVSRDGVLGGRENYIKKLAILVKTGIDMGDVDLDQAVFNDLTVFTPHDYLLHGGKMVCEPLAPHLKIYIEYGNENWNGNFAQTAYCAEEGLAMNFGWGPGSAGRVFSAYASLKLYEAFAAVFGKDATRIEDILPLQRHGLFYANYSFTQVFDNPVLNPNNFMPEHISGATYFSNGEDGADANIQQIMLEDIGDIMTEVRDMRTFLDEAGQQRNRQFGLISYEGGHHINNNYEAVNSNPIIYDTYLTFLDSMNTFFEEIILYNHVSTNAFGLKQYIGQPLAEAHKYRAVTDWLPATLPDSSFCQDDYINLSVDTLPNSEYKAADSLEATGVLPIFSKASFLANHSITLKAGFQVDSGALFNATIDTCVAPSMPVNNGMNILTQLKVQEITPTVIKPDLKLVISPNPTQESATVSFDALEAAKAEIAVFSLTGQLMTRRSFEALEGRNEVVLQLGDFLAGIYFVRLVVGGEMVASRVSVL